MAKKQKRQGKGLAMALTLVLALWGAKGNPGRIGVVLCCAAIAICLWYEFSGWALKRSLTVAEKLGRVALVLVLAVAASVLYGWQFWPVPQKPKEGERARIWISQVQFLSDTPEGLPVNIYLTNSGSETAKDFVVAHAVFSKSDFLSKTDLDSLFNDIEPKVQKIPGMPMVVQAGETKWMTRVTPGITADDVRDINAGKKGLYLLLVLEYSDPYGRRVTEYCTRWKNAYVGIDCDSHNGTADIKPQ